MGFTNRLHQLHITLPPPPKPAGSYRPVIVEGELAFLSGQISRAADGKIISGKVGKDLTAGEGKSAARTAALNVLSLIQHFVGFEKLERLLRVTAYIQAAPDFYEIPAVADGASDLFLEIFGEKGVHVRSAVGMASLPLNAAVELEVTLKIKP